MVGFFSLEMSSEQLATRMLAEQAEVPSEKIRKGELISGDFAKVLSVSQTPEHLNFFIDAPPAPPMSPLRPRASRTVRCRRPVPLAPSREGRRAAGDWPCAVRRRG